MLIDGFLSDPAPDQASLVAGLRQRLQKLGRSLTHDGKRLEGPAAEARLNELAAGFLRDDLANLRQLGVLA